MTKIQGVFGKNLKKERQRKGLTQEQLAERCDISLNHLASMEAGRRFPSSIVFQRIADELEVEPYLFLVPSDGEDDAEVVALYQRISDHVADELSALIEKRKPRPK